MVRLKLLAFMLKFHKSILYNPHEPTSTSTQLPYSSTPLPPEVNDHNVRGRWGRSLTHDQSPDRVNQKRDIMSVSQVPDGVYRLTELV